MMAAAQRDKEFVTHLASERGVLCEPQVVRIRRPAATDQAWLLGNEFDVGLVPKPTRLR
jgi:hypothetical protein